MSNVEGRVLSVELKKSNMTFSSKNDAAYFSGVVLSLHFLVVYDKVSANGYIWIPRMGKNKSGQIVF